MHIGMPWCALDWAGGPLGSSAVNALCVYGFVCAEDEAGGFSALQCAEVSACMLLSGPVVAPVVAADSAVGTTVAGFAAVL